MAWTVQGTTGAAKNHLRLASDAIDASGTNSSAAFDASGWDSGELQVVHASHAANTSTWEVQVSLDGGNNYDTVSGSSTTNSGAAGSDTIRFTDYIPGGLFKVVITDASQATSTLTPYLLLKRKL